MDRIRIEGLEIYGYHGVFEEEKRQGQTFVINCEMKTDFTRAAREDALDYSTDYGNVCLFLREKFTIKSYDLIEAVAVNTAEALLIKFPGIKEISLEVKKPEAPIPMKFQWVSVCVRRKWHQVYCSFGSNMGDREKYIMDALEVLKKDQRCRNICISSFYPSKAYGGVEQEDFLNGVFSMETFLSPQELLDYFHQLEDKAGRKRMIRWGPRCLDLDILFFDSLVIDEKDLQIPHKDMVNRDFVLIPLKEIGGHVRHPVLNKTVDQLAEELQESYVI